MTNYSDCGYMKMDCTLETWQISLTEPDKWVDGFGVIEPVPRIHPEVCSPGMNEDVSGYILTTSL